MISQQEIRQTLQQLRGRRFIVKLGGEVMLNAPGLDALAADVTQLSSQGVEVVVVHGGGPQADALAEQLGHTVRKVAGRRITDDDALLVAKMVYGGSINVDLLAALKRHGARGVGISGVDANLITVTHRPPLQVLDPATRKERLVDFGHVGDVAAVDPALLYVLLGAGYVPVVASLAADTAGNVYNVNADTVAQAIAVSLGASALILVTNVPGILLDPADRSSLLSSATPARLAYLVETGVITGGMLPKVQNCLEALQRGVSEVRILDGSQDRSFLLESLLHEGVGTVIRNA